MTWKELCEDKRFQDLPFKVELNAQGQILMSPTSNYHGSYGFRIGRLLFEHLKSGEIVVECAVETSDGTKEVDVAWLSDARWAQVRDDFSCKVAPEICVEVLSPSNTDAEMMRKRELYFEVGASEYWLCDRQGSLRFFGVEGELAGSRLCPQFPRSVK